jgi:hypothetical protein
VNDAPDPVKPKIDDRYWFTFSETLVSKAPEKFEQAASKLQTLVVWLWGLYTASAAVGFGLSGKALAFWPTLLIASASASLIAVYWGSVWVQAPVIVEFDPRSPTEIMKAYGSSVKVKAKRLKITLALSVLAAVMVSLALISASVSKQETPTAPAFEASIHSEDNRRTLAVTGTVGDAKKVTVYVQPLATGGKAKESRSFTFMPTKGGLLQTNVPLDTKVAEIEIKLEWDTSTGMKINLSRRVGEEKKAAGSK